MNSKARQGSLLALGHAVGIELHRRADKPIPEGWGIDAQGESITDAAQALNGAMLRTPAVPP